MKPEHDAILNRIFHKPSLRSASESIDPVDSVPVAPVKKENAITLWLARVFLKLRGRPFWEKHLTTLFYGPRSNGKSLHQAKTALSILKWLDDVYKAYPDLPQAIMVSNQKFNKQIEEKYLGSRLFYWESIQQLKFCPRAKCWKDEDEEQAAPAQIEIANPKMVAKYAKKAGDPRGVPIPKAAPRKKQHPLHDCYMLIDDAATIIPADGWQDLPVWFRKVFAQAGHNGVHVIANIQDPVSCDINFRRYTDLAFKFNKIMGNRRPEHSKPPVKFIWGIYTSREIPAEELWKHGDKSEAEIQQEEIDRRREESMARAAGERVVTVAVNHWRRRFHFIRRKDTEIYDTLQNVPAYMPNSLEHIELKCVNPDCAKVHVRHRVI